MPDAVRRASSAPCLRAADPPRRKGHRGSFIAQPGR